MKGRSWIRFTFAIVAIAVVLNSVEAADSLIGTWVRQKSGSALDQSEMIMIVEPWGSDGGRRLTYHLKFGNQDAVMMIESPFDGTEAPVLLNGKPSGETMAIKRLDDHHAFTVLKFNGKEFGTSRGTLSDDFNTLTVENEFSTAAGGHQPGKNIEIWKRK